MILPVIQKEQGTNISPYDGIYHNSTPMSNDQDTQQYTGSMFIDTRGCVKK